jgi:PAS domain S-box-containing protein
LRKPPRELHPDRPGADGGTSPPAADPAEGSSLELELGRLRAERDELVAREQAAAAAAQSAQRRLRAIEYVTEAALEHLDEGELLAEVLRRVRQVLDADTAAVHLLGAGGSSLVLRSWSGLEVASREDVIVPVGLGVAGRAARARAPVVIPDTGAEPELSPAFRQAVRSLLAVPLASRERVLGVVQVGWAAAREITEDDRRLLQALAARTALALENALLFGETHYERARWQAMVESLLDPVVVADAEGRAVYTNPAYERLVQRRPRENLDAGAPSESEQFFRGDGTPFTVEDLPLQRAARRGEEVRDLETLLRGSDGGELHVVFSASPLRDPRGRVMGAVAVGRDVTAARAAELEKERLLDEVQRRAAELEATVSAIAEGLIVNRPDGQIVRMNRAAELTLGLTMEEMGKPYEERIRHYEPHDAQGMPIAPDQFPVARALRGETLRGELICLRRAGRDLWLTVSSAAIRDRGGRTLGTVTTLTDVTRQREAAEQREDLLRAVSHDLRTPLTSLLLQAHRLASHPDQDVKRRGEVITNGARRMEALISDLVESARLETGQIQLDLRPVNLGSYLSDLLARTPALDTSRVALEAEPGTAVLADPDRLERVLVNLVSNALKYSPPGTPVRLTVRRAGDEVVMAITDQGDGIPAEELPKIFGRYYRSQRTRSVEGTGLGLYIARLLVEAHRGRLGAESAVGKGSTFSVTLPAGG